MQDFHFRIGSEIVTVSLPPGYLVRLDGERRLVVEPDPDWSDSED